MSEIQDALLDIYAHEKRLAECSYGLMGKMLDLAAVEQGVGRLDTPAIYIYGGGYLGIQFYRAAGHFIKIKAVVDKKGKTVLDIPDIPVISDEQLKEIYQGEKIVVTSIRYYEEIKKGLSVFVDPGNIRYLGEIFGGVCDDLYNLH